MSGTEAPTQLPANPPAQPTPDPRAEAARFHKRWGSWGSECYAKGMTEEETAVAYEAKLREELEAANKKLADISAQKSDTNESLSNEAGTDPVSGSNVGTSKEAKPKTPVERFAASVKLPKR